MKRIEFRLTISGVNKNGSWRNGAGKNYSITKTMSDAEVERSGLEVLAKHALWSLDVDDALALRLAALEAAEVVFRVCHQLHGAVGFCDETTLSWLSRYSQPLRRLPFGLSATRQQLTQRVGRRGLTGLFSQRR